MPGRPFRTTVRVALLIATAVAAAAVAEAQAAYKFDVPAQPLADALRDVGRQTNTNIIFEPALVKGLQAAALRVDTTTDEAINTLLSGTGLIAQRMSASTVVIKRIAALSPAPTSSNVQGAEPELEQIVVTAQKRLERLQDVPVSITVLNTGNLAENGQNRLADFFSQVPGLSLDSNTFGGGSQYVTIRGLSAGKFQNATVANVVDDVPIGASTSLAYGMYTAPDLDPSDLARIEVLKGPQGTLYGADSLGGLIKYVTADPSTAGFSGRAEVSGSAIPSGGLGYAARAAVNIPVSEELALRINGFSRRDPGYIDNLTTGQNNINATDVYGGHMALLYRPSDSFSLKLGALFQNADSEGDSFVNSDSMLNFRQGDLKQTSLPGLTRWHTSWQLYTATLNAKLPGVNLASVTGYNVNTLGSWLDYSGFSYFSGIANQHFPGSFGYTDFNHYYTGKFSQEIRLSGSVHQWFDWLGGVFYSHEASPDTAQRQYAAELATGALTGSLINFNYTPLDFTEHALFGAATFHITDRFEVQLGGRESWNSTYYGALYVGPAALDYYPAENSTVHYQPPVRANGSAFTYLLTPKFAISPDLQLYARFASGYRIGGPNLDTGVQNANIPLSYKPDKTNNYELGVKGDLLDHRLSFDAAAYYIDWKDFQIAVQYSAAAGFIANAGNAKSEGVELHVETHPLKGLTLTAQGSYNYAVLTQDLPPDVVAAGAYGLAGDRLPYSIRASGGLTLSQDFRLVDDWVGLIGGAVTYVGARPSEFASAPPPVQRDYLSAYTRFDLHVGARTQSWLINFYVNNVTDSRGVIGITNFGSNFGNTGGYQAAVIQPRTVGLSVARNF